MWADSTFEDLVQYNDGFRTQLIGTPEQIAERIAAYRKRGVDLILGGFLHFQEEIEYFGSRVLPLVREIEDSEEDSVGAPVLLRVALSRSASIHGCASVDGRIAQASSTGEVMSYPPGSPGYPPAQQPTTQFAAPTQQFGKLPEQQLRRRRRSEQAAHVSDRRSGGAWPRASTCRASARCSPRAQTSSRRHCLISAWSRRCSRRCWPVSACAQAEAAARARRGAVGAGLPAGDRDRADRAGRRVIDWGLYLIIAFSVVQAIVAVAVLLFDAGVITAAGAAGPSTSSSSSNTASTAARARTTDSPSSPAARRTSSRATSSSARATRPHGMAAATRAARRPAGSRAAARRPPGRPADPAHRFPDLRPAAGEHTRRPHRCRCNHSHESAIVVILAVRPSAVVVWAARASTSRA